MCARSRWVLLMVALASVTLTAGQSTPLSALTRTTLEGGAVQVRGMVTLEVAGKPVAKRFVLRLPGDARAWNGALVIGAHGGGGGDNYDRSGKVIGTDETALDDVIGRHAIASGFAYASVDRDGAGGGRDGLALTNQFTDLVESEIAARKGSAPQRVYLVGLSAGGGITRLAAEDAQTQFAGTLIIAGAGGDLPTRLDRQKRMAALWADVDPRAHPGLAVTDPKRRAYAEAIGTPVEAWRLWPYTGASAVTAAARPATTSENASGVLHVPTIEVVGTWDDLVIRELRAYSARVRPQNRHRLYQVDGVWHMSGDDDGVWSFQYIAESRMKLGKDVADAMGEGPSYLPTVREAFDRLVAWVEKGTAPPKSQTVKPGQRIR
jgi:acetyl esterase/lipase